MPDPLITLTREARPEDGACRHLLVWRPGPGWRMLSSAVVGGGLGPRDWFLNAQVRPGYSRLDPEAHLHELAAGLGLTGPGVGLLTAADVDAVSHAADHGVEAVVTAGVGVGTWAAADEPPRLGPQPAGTVNILVAVPAPLGDAALVNCLATATEAKVQALLAAGYDCSGTPSDAVCVAARRPRPGQEPEPFGGPRSRWGARLARAVYRAVHEAALRDAERRAAGDPVEHAAESPACRDPELVRVAAARALHRSAAAEPIAFPSGAGFAAADTKGLISNPALRGR